LKSNNIYINEVLTAIQDTANYGQRKDKRILQKGEVVVMVLNRKMGEVGAIKYMQEEQALSLQRFKMLKIID
jgi:ArsR family metal-binding transcriptional regulator